MADETSNLKSMSSENLDEEMEDIDQSERTFAKPPLSEVERPISTRLKNKEKELEIERISEKLIAHEEKIQIHLSNMAKIDKKY